jgi:prepilin-type processing-associated H-X9-DG protein
MAMRSRITVLVVALLLLVVGGLVLNAVARVQDAAARTQCCNNLKQLALAIHSYNDTVGALPAGTVPNDALPPEKRLSWLPDLVPFVEFQVASHLLLDPTKAWDAEGNREPRVEIFDEDRDGQHQRREYPVGPLRFLQCPSNPAAAVPGFPALTHYVGVAGVGADAATLPASHPDTEIYPGTGVFGYDRHLALGPRIPDGSAVTLLLVETTRDNGPWTAGGRPTVRGLDPDGGPYLGQGGQFGANHRYGSSPWFRQPPFATNVAFVDGSVRSLTDSIKPEVFEALATVAGGEEVGRVGDE